MERKTSIEEFVLDTYQSWYGQKCAVRPRQFSMSPGVVGYKNIAKDIISAQFGAYTINPAMVHVDYARARVFIPDISQFIGHHLYEVVQYTFDTYGTTHYLPGIEYWQWLWENKKKLPEVLKDGYLYFLPGSLMRGNDGHWNVPYSVWDSSQLDRASSLLKVRCGGVCRVMLLEIEH